MNKTTKLLRFPQTTMVAASVVGLGLLFGQSARAQFTYTGGTLNADQVYDGVGVDSGSNPLTIGSGITDNYIK